MTPWKCTKDTFFICTEWITNKYCVWVDFPSHARKWNCEEFTEKQKENHFVFLVTYMYLLYNQKNKKKQLTCYSILLVFMKGTVPQNISHFFYWIAHWVCIFYAAACCFIFTFLWFAIIVIKHFLNTSMKEITNLSDFADSCWYSQAKSYWLKRILKVASAVTQRFLKWLMATWMGFGSCCQ